MFIGAGSLLADDLLYNYLFPRETLPDVMGILNIGALFGVIIDCVLLSIVATATVKMILACAVGVVGCALFYVLRFLPFAGHEYIAWISITHLTCRFCQGMFCGIFAANFVLCLLQSTDLHQKEAIPFVMNFGLFLGSLVAHLCLDGMSVYQFALLPMVCLVVLAAVAAVGSCLCGGQDGQREFVGRAKVMRFMWLC